jgi:hypothetical protein
LRLIVEQNTRFRSHSLGGYWSLLGMGSEDVTYKIWG